MIHGTRDGLLFTLFQLGTLGRLGVSTVVPGRQGKQGSGMEPQLRLGQLLIGHCWREIRVCGQVALYLDYVKVSTKASSTLALPPPGTCEELSDPPDSSCTVKFAHHIGSDWECTLHCLTGSLLEQRWELELGLPSRKTEWKRGLFGSGDCVRCPFAGVCFRPTARREMGLSFGVAGFSAAASWTGNTFPSSHGVCGDVTVPTQRERTCRPVLGVSALISSFAIWNSHPPAVVL